MAYIVNHPSITAVLRTKSVTSGWSAAMVSRLVTALPLGYVVT